MTVDNYLWVWMQDKSYDQLLEFDKRKISLTVGAETLIMRLVNTYLNAQVIILFHNSGKYLK
jgi:hypothetical protein